MNSMIEILNKILIFDILLAIKLYKQNEISGNQL
jgi:hypothetical protein